MFTQDFYDTEKDAAKEPWYKYDKFKDPRITKEHIAQLDQNHQDIWKQTFNEMMGVVKQYTSAFKEEMDSYLPNIGLLIGLFSKLKFHKDNESLNPHVPQLLLPVSTPRLLTFVLADMLLKFEVPAGRILVTNAPTFLFHQSETPTQDKMQWAISLRTVEPGEFKGTSKLIEEAKTVVQEKGEMSKQLTPQLVYAPNNTRFNLTPNWHRISFRVTTTLETLTLVQKEIQDNKITPTPTYTHT